MTNYFTERRLLYALIIVFILIATVYSIVVPVFEVSDELWHYPMVKTLADGNGLPVQNPDNPGPWRQEGSQPPLYYYIGAVATFWIDTSDIDAVRQINPHVDNGIITEDGNNNMIVHNRTLEAFPWRQTVLAVHIVRFLSVLMSAVTVCFTYLIGVDLFPQKRWLALAGAAVVAFTPMFVFISGSVNNDNLAVMLATIALWLMLQIIKRAHQQQNTFRQALILGVVLGLGSLSKASTLGLFGLAGLTVAYAAWKKGRWQTFFIEGPTIILVAALIGGWWYVRNWQLYGDPLGLNMFVATAGRRDATLAHLWGERVGFLWSYWGLFGGVSVPIGRAIYPVLNILAAFSVIGTGLFLWRKARKEPLTWEGWSLVILSLLWPPIVFASLIRWTSMTQASQGRLMFSAISVISLWFMAGLSGWIPEKWGKVIAVAVVGGMGVLTILTPFVWIAPHYQVVRAIDEPSQTVSYEFTPPGSAHPVMRLRGYDLDIEKVQPGQTVYLTLYWESLASMDRNWSVFVHLQDSMLLHPGQRDMYPGLGLIATRQLEPGTQWVEQYAISLSETAYAPEQLDVNVGLYDLHTGERMLLADEGDTVTLGQITLEERTGAGDIPNPIEINYGNELSLIGYTIDNRQVRPGETLVITLYWQGLKQMEKDYSISVQVLDLSGNKIGQVDNWPVEGTLPTTTWEVGQTVEDVYHIPISPEAVPGIYHIQVVVYVVSPEGQITRLDRVIERGRSSDAPIYVNRIRIVP